MKLTRNDVKVLIVALLLFLSMWQPLDAVTPVTQPPSALYLPAVGAGDYYEVNCPDAGEVCPAGGSGITPIRRRIH